MKKICAIILSLMAGLQAYSSNFYVMGYYVFEGAGSAADPIRIYTLEDLTAYFYYFCDRLCIFYSTDTREDTYHTCYYHAALMNDIVVNEIEYDENGIALNQDELVEIGAYFFNGNYIYLKGLCGTFDGQGHSIIGVYVDQDNNPTDVQYKVNCAKLGLFMTVTQGGTIKNVNFKEMYVKGSHSCSHDVGHDDPLGMLCHLNSGTITNCSVEATLEIDTDTINSCGFAGICAENSGIISHCATDIKVVGITPSYYKNGLMSTSYLQIDGIAVAGNRNTDADNTYGSLHDSFSTIRVDSRFNPIWTYARGEFSCYDSISNYFVRVDDYDFLRSQGGLIYKGFLKTHTRVYDEDVLSGYVANATGMGQILGTDTTVYALLPDGSNAVYKVRLDYEGEGVFSDSTFTNPTYIVPDTRISDEDAETNVVFWQGIDGTRYSPGDTLTLTADEDLTQVLNTKQIYVTAGITTAYIQWAPQEEVDSYDLYVYTDAELTELLLHLAFDEDGRLTSFDFVYNKSVSESEYSFTLTGLDSDHEYGYRMTTTYYDESTVNDTGTFTTLKNGSDTKVADEIEIVEWSAVTKQSAIVLSGLTTFDIYDVAGKLIYHGEAAEVDVPIGIYIVRAEGRSEKVLVK